MSVTVILEATTQDGRSGDFLDLLREFLPDTRQYKGCEGLTVHQNEDDGNNFVLLETWSTRKEYEEYLGWRKDRGDLDKLGATLAAAPSIRFFDYQGA